MNVTIIVGGRFHAFDLAEQLQKHGLLYQLVTTYPKSKIKRFNIPKEKCITFPAIEYFKRGVHKLFGFYPLNYFLNNLFDKKVSKKVEKNADVYIIWAGMALNTIKKIKKINPKAKIILERGSTHITEQNALLKKATGKDLIDKRTLKKELEEYELVNYISVPSNFAKNGFLKFNIPKNKLFINPYGVDLKMFYPQKNKRKFFTAGYAGTLSSQKNIAGIVKAVEILINKDYNIKLSLVGNINHKTFDKEILNKEFISYNTAVPQKELNKHYNRLDLYIQNSAQDGFGMVVLQALACGVPVVASTNTGAADVIKEGVNGFVIPTFDNNALAEQIELVYNLPKNKLEEIQQNAINSVKSGFTWDDYGKRYVKFLKQITE